jgi:hypothetical protein
MALLSFADSAPRAYWLKVGNAYLTFSTSMGTSPLSPVTPVFADDNVRIHRKVDHVLFH